MQKEKDWDLIIKPNRRLFDLRVRELARFKDLLILFVWRDLTVIYKQTVFGPVWFFLQPVLSTITFTFVFSKLAGLSTNGIPAPVFYMSGIVAYSYFSETLRKTSASFIQNSHIFSKVYFPRVLIPLSISFGSLVTFLIQLFVLALLIAYFFVKGDVEITINQNWFLLPFLVLIMALLGLGFGVLIAALTTKFKDLIHLVGFGVQLLMYLSPVIYPVDNVDGLMRTIIMLNPMSSVIESFRTIIFGVGIIDGFALIYSFMFSVIIFFLSILVFNKIDRTFTDTI